MKLDRLSVRVPASLVRWFLAVMLGVSTQAAGGVLRLPHYTPAQLSDGQFLIGEIAALESMRRERLDRLPGASELVRAALQEDLRRIEYALSALRYVQTNGFRPDDPGLRELEYFRRMEATEPTPAGSETDRVRRQDSGQTPTARIGASKRPPPPAAPVGEAPSLEGASAAATAEQAGPLGSGRRIDLNGHLVKGQTTVFEFFSEYCPPCRRVAPLLEQLDRQRSDLTVVRLDVNRPGVRGIDWDSPLAAQFSLSSLPAFLVYSPRGELQAQGRPAYIMVGRMLAEAGIRP
jgi:thiol-disulfide isomerase/thioredoxin